VTARKPGARRGRPVEVPALVIVAIRAALARGEGVARVAKAYDVSARYVRNLRAGERRPEAVAEPAEIEALATVTGDLASEARQMSELWRILTGR
jgi:transposase-like protein